MTDSQLVPSGTTVTAKGDGAAVDISAAASRVFLVTFTIEKIIEQESIDLSIWGSADGANWGAKALAAFPQKFYSGEHPLLLDLTNEPAIKFVRAHWEVGRWGRGAPTPMFQVQVGLREVPPQMLGETRAAAAGAR